MTALRLKQAEGEGGLGCYLAYLAEGGSSGVTVAANLGTTTSQRATMNLGTPAGQPTTSDGGPNPSLRSGVADSLWWAGSGGGSRSDARERRRTGGREAGSCGDGAGEQHGRREAGSTRSS
jgi:hypothetical protein